MAHLTADEFSLTIRILAEDLGLHRLRERLVKLNALVMRRRAASPEALAEQLYMLTGGLRRQVPATVALQGLWSERVSERLGEEGDKELEELAEKINGCLGDRDQIAADKETEIDDLLERYEERLARSIGGQRARLDMLLKAVPAVAAKLRARPVRADSDPAASPATEATGQTTE
jgi:hypothetical protein